MMELKLKLPPFEVDPDNPFENDKFFEGTRKMRETEVLNLTGVIKTNASPLVMAVNSSWGTGKTAFIKMWMAHLNKAEQAHVCALRFNAWETDFVADPFVPFLAEMEKTVSPKPEQKAKWDEIKKEGIKLLPRLIGAGVSAGIGGIPNLACISGVSGTIAEKIAEASAKNAVQSCNNQADAVKKFKGALRGYIKSSGQRVVIFVDELDRCRPDYAVKVLERIKHLFEVNGLMFVLAIDREQLQHSIRGLYGAGLDANNYLRRFIDFDYTIKEPARSEYWKVLLDELGTNAFLKKHKGRFADENMFNPLPLLGEVYRFSLRDIEQFMLRLNLVLSTVEGEVAFPEFLAFLMVLRERDSRQLAAYLNGDASKGTVSYWENKLTDANIKFADTEDKSMFAAGYITACLILAKHSGRTKYAADKFKEYDQKAGDEGLSPEERSYVSGVTRCMTACREEGLNVKGMLENYVRKIGLLDQLNQGAAAAESGDWE